MPKVTRQSSCGGAGGITTDFEESPTGAPAIAGETSTPARPQDNKREAILRFMRGGSAKVRGIASLATRLPAPPESVHAGSARTLMFFQSQGEDDVHETSGDGVSCDQPHEGDGSRAREDHDANAKEDGQDAVHDEHPLVVDLLAQL